MPASAQPRATEVFQVQTFRVDRTRTGQVTVSGRAVPYGKKIRHWFSDVQFAPGSIDTEQALTAPLLYGHNYSDSSAWLGGLTDAVNSNDGLDITAEVIDKPMADKLMAAQESGRALPGLSVGIDIERYEVDADDESITYLSAILRELSITPIPAFGDDSALTGVEQHSRKDTPMPDTPTTQPAAAADAAEGDEFLTRDEFDAAIARLSQPAPAQPARVDVRQAFAQLVTTYGDNPSIRRFADMVSADNAGLTDTARTSQEIIDYFDATRYFIRQTASMPFPETGIVHHLPKKTQRSIAGTTAEKVEAPSQAIQTAVVDFTGEWYKSWLDISYELIRTSSPGAVGVAVDDMLDSCAYDSEAKFVAAVEAAATAGGAVIDFTDWGTFIVSVRSAAKAIRAAAGAAPPKFALTSASWDELLAFTDADGRRMLSTVGPANADGSANLLAMETSIGGILFFESPESTVDVGFNDNSLRSSELPPMQLSADNPSLVGHDVAVIGNIMAVTRVPEGIIKFAAV